LKLREYFDFWSLIVIITTGVLFGVALFVKGFTHDLLLEAAIFLVSLKLIMMSYKSGKTVTSIKTKLDEIHDSVRK